MINKTFTFDLFNFTHDYALLCDSYNKCNLQMVKHKCNPFRFILFDIYL